MENEETEKENGSEGAVQERTFNYFAWPQPKVLNLFLNVMAMQKKRVIRGFRTCCGCMGCLDECEISLPEILSQSCPVLHGGCSVMMHSLANKILNVSYFVLMCQYDVRSSYQCDTKTGSSNGYFLLK